jgi:cell division transport system ATP-binding protein
MIDKDAPPNLGYDLLDSPHPDCAWNPCSAESSLATPALLELIEVTKASGGDSPVLDRVSLRMEKGEFLFVVGPNQAGKTTLLKLIAAEERPTSGEIHFAGFDSRKIRKRQIPLLRRKLGRICEDLKLVEQMNVFDNVALAPRILGQKERKVKRKVFQALGMVGLCAKARAYPRELSSAERQKAAVARAMAGDPLLLLADDPACHLDEEAATEILGLLGRINLSGTAVLVAASDLRGCGPKQARMIRMERGRLV